MMKKNKLFSVLLIMILLVALSFVYKALMYDNNKKIVTDKDNQIYDEVEKENITENISTTTNDNVEEEINLGDIANCDESVTTYSCPSDTVQSGTYCYSDGRDYGSYCDGTIIGVICYHSKKAATKTTTCKKCKNFYYLSDDKKSCQKCKITNISASREKISPGTQWCIWSKVQFNSNKCSTTGATYSPGSCTTATKEDACHNSQITVTYGDQSITVKVPVMDDWKTAEDGLYSKDMVKTERDADAWKGSHNTDPKMEYGNCEASEVVDGKTLYYCTGVHQRGICGTKRTPSYDYCCVNNQFVGVSSSVKWASHVYLNHDQKKNGKYGCAYYFGDDYTYVNASKDKCKVTEDIPGRCSKSSVNLNKAEQETTNCEEDHVIELFEGEKCTGTDLGIDGSSITNSFYSISCERKINTNFDYGDDNDTNTIREIFRGQGFKFGITVTSKVKCDGEFFGNRWKNVYEKLWTKIENIEDGLVKACKSFDDAGLTRCENYINSIHYNRENTHKDVFELLNIIRKLVEIVNDYNKYEPSMDYDEKANIDFKYLINGVVSPTEVNENFDKEEISKGTYENDRREVTVDLGVDGLTNPKNYSRSNHRNPRVVKLTFKNVYVNKTDGSIETNSSGRLDGGRKIYIGYNAAVQTISPITIKVTGLASNNSSVTNDKCTVKINDIDVIYRPIDESNPFINSSWVPGKNWLNSKFDFRSIISSGN